MAETERTDSEQQAHVVPQCWREPRWPASVALIAAIVLYVLLPDRLVYGPKFLVPILEAVALLPLQFTTPHRHTQESPWRRATAIALIALINVANVGSLILLIQELIGGKVASNQGRQLIYAAILIWLTNVIIFSLWYWELDRGGPGARCSGHEHQPDFLFPQMSSPSLSGQHWHPSFLDYVYVSFTNAAAFSPTDTMPLSEAAKMLMLVESLASLLTIGLVAARAVNILG